MIAPDLEKIFYGNFIMGVGIGMVIMLAFVDFMGFLSLGIGIGVTLLGYFIKCRGYH